MAVDQESHSHCTWRLHHSPISGCLCRLPKFSRTQPALRSGCANIENNIMRFELIFDASTMLIWNTHKQDQSQQNQKPSHGAKFVGTMHCGMGWVGTDKSSLHISDCSSVVAAPTCLLERIFFFAPARIMFMLFVMARGSLDGVRKERVMGATIQVGSCNVLSIWQPEPLGRLRHVFCEASIEIRHTTMWLVCQRSLPDAVGESSRPMGPRISV